MNGYLGKILHVDLGHERLWDEPLNEEFARGYVGGSGLGARYLYDVIDQGTDPLGPDNPLLFLTGPLVGTSFTSAGRYSVCARSPLTGIWGEANSGGFFGPELRYAGYDGVWIHGSAKRPVWISVVEGAAALHDGAAIWGGDIYGTQRYLRESLSEPRARVACIGLAGEHQVKLAGIANDHGRFAARAGLGAVMGSKNLKAIAVRGTAKVPLRDPESFKAASNRALALFKEDMGSQSLHSFGTAGYVNLSHMLGDFPIRYFQLGEWPGADELSGVDMAEKYMRRNTACHKCVIACGRETFAPAYGDEKVDGPEYEACGALGSLLMISDLQAVIHANHLCNLYGMDVISTGVTLGLACELFERGLLGAADTGGLEIRYGDAQMVFRLIEMMARREGFGAVLAEGNAALAERTGVPELSATVNRLEVPMHDPRAYVGMAVTYALSPRGACHMEGNMYDLDLGQSSMEDIGLVAGDRHENSAAKGRMAARLQAWRNLYNSLTLCEFENPTVSVLLQAVNSATGWGWAAEDLMSAGKRIVNIKRLLNFKLGLTRSSDRLPDLLLKPLQKGGSAGIVPDMPTLLSGAYAEFGWNPDTGRPAPEFLP